MVTMPKYRKKSVKIEWAEQTEQLILTNGEPEDLKTMPLKTTMTVPLWGYFPVNPLPTRK